MQNQTISINGEKKGNGCNNGCNIEEPRNNSIQIVIFQRGWIMIGKFSKNNTDCMLHNAYVIRRWGTTYGLGQLAIEGKQADTVLDKIPDVRFSYPTTIALIECDESKWKNLY